VIVSVSGSLSYSIGSLPEPIWVPSRTVVHDWIIRLTIQHHRAPAISIPLDSVLKFSFAGSILVSGRVEILSAASVGPGERVIEK
jgi:hypothetical protein